MFYITAECSDVIDVFHRYNKSSHFYKKIICISREKAFIMFKIC